MLKLCHYHTLVKYYNSNINIGWNLVKNESLIIDSMAYYEQMVRDKWTTFTIKRFGKCIIPNIVTSYKTTWLKAITSNAKLNVTGKLPDNVIWEDIVHNRKINIGGHDYSSLLIIINGFLCGKLVYKLCAFPATGRKSMIS